MSIDDLGCYMGDRIFVGVISYNQEAYIRECLDSLVEQEKMPDKIIVFDDFSTDGTQDIIKEFLDRYPEVFDVYLQDINQGAFKHDVFLRKTILAYENCDFFCYIEGDDYWDTNKLMNEYNALKAYPEADFAYSNVCTIDSYGKPLAVWHKLDGEKLKSGNLFYHVASRTIFNNSGNCFRNYMMRHKCLVSSGWKVDDNIPSMGDYDSHLHLSYLFNFVGIDTNTPMVFYRRHGAGISSRSSEIAFSSMKIYEKYKSQIEGLPIEKYLQVFLSQELGRCSARKYFDDEMREYYSPSNIIGRLVDKINEMERRDWNAFKERNIQVIRKLIVLQVEELIEKGKMKDALAVSNNFLKHDPEPVRACLYLPKKLFDIFNK